jgi:hypothetical protein
MLPYYEEARLYWNQAEQDGLFDGATRFRFISLEHWSKLSATRENLLEDSV